MEEDRGLVLPPPTFSLIPKIHIHLELPSTQLNIDSSTEIALLGLLPKVAGCQHVPPDPFQGSDWRGQMPLAGNSEESAKSKAPISVDGKHPNTKSDMDFLKEGCFMYCLRILTLCYHSGELY